MTLTPEETRDDLKVYPGSVQPGKDQMIIFGLKAKNADVQQGSSFGEHSWYNQYTNRFCSDDVEWWIPMSDLTEFARKRLSHIESIKEKKQ